MHSSVVRVGLVERVVKVFPHEQVTLASMYSGWISVFMVCSL